MIDKEIIKIASNTENHGVLNNHTHFSRLKNSICGDEIKVYLIIEDNKILRERRRDKDLMSQVTGRHHQAANIEKAENSNKSTEPND